MKGKGAHLFKAGLVDQDRNAFTRGEFAGRVLLLNPIAAAAEFNLRASERAGRRLRSCIVLVFARSSSLAMRAPPWGPASDSPLRRLCPAAPASYSAK